MRITFSTVFVLMVVALVAQDTFPFPHASAFWHVAKTYPAGAPEDPGFTATTTRRFFIEGDSTVAGATWAIFRSEPTPSGPQQYEGLVRQAGPLVFGMREDLSLDTLYDFNLEIGDSTHYLINDWLSTWLHVISVDSVVVNGAFHRIITFNEVIDAPSGLREAWIEAIGSIHGPLFPLHPTTFSTEVPGDSLMLTCYGRNDTVLWDHPGYAACTVNILLGSAEPDPPAALAVHPNPSDGPLRVEWPQETTYDLCLLDALGQPVIHQHGLPANPPVDTGNLPPGCYLVILTGASGDRATARWVKR